MISKEMPDHFFQLGRLVVRPLLQIRDYQVLLTDLKEVLSDVLLERLHIHQV
jgi:hypothetical protein